MVISQVLKLARISVFIICYIFVVSSFALADDMSRKPPTEYYKLQHMLQFNITQKVKFVRQGCKGIENLENRKVCEKALDGTDIEFGICPSVEWLVYNWPLTPDTTSCSNGESYSGSNCFEVAKKCFAEVSIGKLFNARDIENWLTAAGEKAPFDSSWKIYGHLRRIIDVYCDVASVAAVKKFHTDTKAKALTYMSENQKMTTNEKAILHQLIGYVDRELAEAEESIRAKDEPTYRLVTAGSQSERCSPCDVSSFTGSMSKGEKTSSGFTGAGDACDGWDCG